MFPVREKKKPGIQLPDRTTKKKFEQVKPKPELKKSAAKTETQSIIKASHDKNGLHSDLIIKV